MSQMVPMDQEKRERESERGREIDIHTNNVYK